MLLLHQNVRALVVIIGCRVNQLLHLRFEFGHMFGALVAGRCIDDGGLLKKTLALGRQGVADQDPEKACPGSHDTQEPECQDQTLSNAAGCEQAHAALNNSQLDTQLKFNK